MPEHEPQAPTQGQLEHAQKLVDAGEWTDEIEAGAKKIQDEVNAGHAEVLGTGAAVVALDEQEQTTLARLRAEDARIEKDNEAKPKSERTFPLRSNASANRIATAVQPNEYGKMGNVAEAPNIGATLIGHTTYVNQGAKIGDGVQIGDRAFVHDTATIEQDVAIGDDAYVGGDIGMKSKLGANSRIAPGGKIGEEVDAVETSLEVRDGGIVGDRVSFEPGHAMVLGKVGREATVGSGVVVTEEGEVDSGVLVPNNKRISSENSPYSGEVEAAEVS